MMKLVFKVLILFLFLTLILAIIYFFWGDYAELFFSKDRCISWFSEQKQYGWIAGILLLISDIIFPIPATGIMAALGKVYGVWSGTVISSIGSISAGVIGYLVARLMGKSGSRYIATEADLKQFKHFFDRWGAFAVIVSRIMPIMPEVITILAGLAKMKFSRFILALITGSIPVSFLYSLIGNNSALNFRVAMMIAVFLPLLIWSLVIRMVKL